MKGGDKSALAGADDEEADEPGDAAQHAARQVPRQLLAPEAVWAWYWTRHVWARGQAGV